MTATIIRPKKASVGLLISKERQRNFWIAITLLTVGIAVWDRQQLVTKLTSKPLFFAMDNNIFYVSRIGTFEEARLFHAEASRMAAECLFNRNPGAPDYSDRLKLLFGHDAYQAAMKLFGADSRKFQEQQIHQKIEIGKVDILKPNDTSVLTAIHGQIIRSGSFEGRTFTTFTPVTIYFQLGLNKQMSSNSRYPEFVIKFDIHENK